MVKKMEEDTQKHIARGHWSERRFPVREVLHLDLSSSMKCSGRGIQWTRMNSDVCTSLPPEQQRSSEVSYLRSRVTTARMMGGTLSSVVDLGC